MIYQSVIPAMYCKKKFIYTYEAKLTNVNMSQILHNFTFALQQSNKIFRQNSLHLFMNTCRLSFLYLFKIEWEKVLSYLFT